jgi:hypothetical protein
MTRSQVSNSATISKAQLPPLRGKASIVEPLADVEAFSYPKSLFQPNSSISALAFLRVGHSS